jgi:hypothetical protein
MGGTNMRRVKGVIIGYTVDSTHVYHGATYGSLHIDLDVVYDYRIVVCL